MGEAAADIGRAREPVGPRHARRWRQEPPCFDGSETVSRLRPFLRRRDSTARPHRVAIRARNPCLLMRRLFRGRYDGFIRVSLQNEPWNLAGGVRRGQVKGTIAPERDAEEGRHREEAIEAERRPGGETGEVDNVEDVENGGKKCLRFRPASACSIFSEISCQDPIDISIPRP